MLFLPKNEIIASQPIFTPCTHRTHLQIHCLTHDTSSPVPVCTGTHACKLTPALFMPLAASHLAFTHWVHSVTSRECPSRGSAWQQFCVLSSSRLLLHLPVCLLTCHINSPRESFCVHVQAHTRAYMQACICSLSLRVLNSVCCSQ